MQSWAGRGQRAACLTEVDAAESLLLLGNSGDRCLPPSVQKQDGRRTKPQRSPTGDDTIATEGGGLGRQNSPRPKSRPRLSNSYYPPKNIQISQR